MRWVHQQPHPWSYVLVLGVPATSPVLWLVLGVPCSQGGLVGQLWRGLQPCCCQLQVCPSAGGECQGATNHKCAWPPLLLLWRC
jgi:hypothetical protein